MISDIIYQLLLWLLGAGYIVLSLILIISLALTLVALIIVALFKICEAVKRIYLNLQY